MPPKPVAEAPALYVVVESFIADVDGAPVLYQKGEVIHPDDPLVKRVPGNFRAFDFPHPVRRARALAAPEIRAD